MKFVCWRAFLIPVLIFPALLCAGTKDQKKEPSGKKIDSGSFGVFINGHRIGTETFSIYQSSNGSVIQSEFKTEAGTEPAADQNSEMQLAASGDLRRYEWNEVSPGKGHTTLVSNDDFLNEKWTESPQDKPKEQAFLLPPSTNILDDYFFVHREVLAWKFLSSSCKQENGQVKCPSKQRTQLGTLNPRQRASALISMESVGREKVTIRGSEKELNKLELHSEGGDWDLWLDDQLMLQRIMIASEKTEVIRD